MKILAFIPARKGSKRLPGKNIKLLAGRPLIAWTIDAAIKADLATDVFVSTDSYEIAQIAQNYGAEVPFLRPEDLAGDKATIFDALKYTLDNLQQLGRGYDYVVLLQPTSPLRQDFHITEAIKLLEQPGVKSVVSVSEMEYPVQWTMALSASHCLDEFVERQIQTLKTRSQDVGKRYRLNGAIYCARVHDILLHKTFYMPQGTFAYIMDRIYAVDVDDLLDFEYAEFLIGRNEYKK